MIEFIFEGIAEIAVSLATPGFLAGVVVGAFFMWLLS